MTYPDRDQREYERYPASLEVEISSLDIKGNAFTAKGVLNDISGGGANLVTENPRRYYIGQKIDLTIRLPHSSQLNANIGGHGKVAWISEDIPPSKPGALSIGISMDDLLAFEHLLNASG